MASDRYVGVKEEASFGTEAAVPMAFDLTDGLGSMALDVPDDPNIAIPTLGRFQKRHAPGFYSPSGPLDYSADVNTIGWFLKWILGGYKFTAGAVPGTDPNTHEFYATPGSLLPSFTSRVGKDTFEHIFLGCTINKMSLNIENELLAGKLDIIAQKDKKGTLRTSLNEPDEDIFPLAFYNHLLTVDGVDVSKDTKSYSLDYDNGIKADDGQGQGSRFPYGFRAGDGKMSLGLKLKDDTSARLEEYWGGASGPSNDPHIPFEVLSAFNSGLFGNMEIKCPRCYYQKAPTDIKGSEPRTPDFAVGVEATDITLLDGVTIVDSPILITIENHQAEYTLP